MGVYKYLICGIINGGVIMPNETNKNINNDILINTTSIPLQDIPNNQERFLCTILTERLFDVNQEQLSGLMQRCGKRFLTLWKELLKTEQDFYEKLGILRNGENEPRRNETGSIKKAFDRFLGRDDRPNYYMPDQLPVFYTILYCHKEEADKAWQCLDGMLRNEGSPVSNVLYPKLREFLEVFLNSTLHMDEIKQNEILESKDDEVVLACFVTLFNYETLLAWNEDVTAVLKQLNNVIDDEVYKKRYFDCLKEQTCKNEVKDKSIDSDLFIDRYYVLPNIKPKLCNNYNDTIKALITCSPGYGKTSACRAIIAACLCEDAKSLHDEIKKQWMGNKDPKELFPIYIEAKNIDYYVNHNNKELPNSLIDLVFVKDEKRHTNAVKVIKKQLGESGHGRNLLLILDGLDEARLELRKNLTQLVESFRNTYTEANIILTSRPINFDSYNYDETNEKTDTITGLTKYQLSIEGKRLEFIQKWADILMVGSLGDKPTQSWSSQAERIITKNRYLSKLAENPFLLANMVCMIYKNKNNGTPYLLINELLKQLISKRRTFTDLNFTDARKLLSYIAYDLLVRKQSIPLEMLESKFKEASKETKIDREAWNRLSEEISTKAGLMICDYVYDNQLMDHYQENYEPGFKLSYYFQEPMIQKFLAAEWLVYSLQMKYEDDKDSLKENLDLFIAKWVKPELEELWKKTDPETWRDTVLMTQLDPLVTTSGVWKDPVSAANVIEMIFTYLLYISAVTVSDKRISRICEIFEAICLETFSQCIATKNKTEKTNNRYLMLRTLKNNATEECYKKCCDKLKIDGISDIVIK